MKRRLPKSASVSLGGENLSFKLWKILIGLRPTIYSTHLGLHYIPKYPERSYWECEWKFPKTGTVISIGLPGGESGPLPESRQFFLSLPERFDQIVVQARPKLAEALKSWLQEDLPLDIFTAVKLGGVGLDDPRARPVQWGISFETTGENWLGITIPFEGDTPQEAVVDT